MDEAGRTRLAALDLIRGVAVLGILAVNIAGFAGPTGATLSPHIPNPASFADEAVYAAIFVLFEGKMRALFSLLFGAGIVLFVERVDARGENGDLLQLRRLGWLMLFGLLHQFLFWWGDILFTYAIWGIAALVLRDLPTRSLITAALIAFAAWHLAGVAQSFPSVLDETARRPEHATAAPLAPAIEQRVQSELREYRSGFVEQIGIKLRDRPFYSLTMALSSLGETLPLIMLGMALQRLGFFAGAWRRRSLMRVAAWGLLFGTAWTLVILAWVWPRHFPPYTMSAALTYWTAPAHLAMALGYAALLVMAAERIVASALGARIVQVGRMAFSNYLGTTLVMTAIFYGWGLGLVGRFGQAELLGFLLLGWVAMFAFSAAWLARFRQGPLERLWRSLTERRFIARRH